MKYSIKRLITGVFIGLLVCMILVLLILNIWFLEPYYIRDKQEKFKDMYVALKEA